MPSQGLTRIVGVGVDRPRAVLQFAREAVVQAAEFGLLRARDRSRSANSFQVAIDRSRTSGCSIWLNQPMKRVSKPARNAVGEQEIEVLLLDDAGEQFCELS